jgi:NAD(P)-dependent dehydrogenase (short-subunit alcohol dehydrogenase family)
MRTNPIAADGSRGSIVLIASTSGYFGGTSVVSYVASKHGVVGLFRASLRAAEHYGVRLNVVAPFFTPTHITGGYAEKWKERGLPANTVEGVAAAILGTVVDGGKRGECVLVSCDVLDDFNCWLMR